MVGWSIFLNMCNDGIKRAIVPFDKDTISYCNFHSIQCMHDPYLYCSLACGHFISHVVINVSDYAF